MKGLSKNFFLLSFIPALAYWYLDEYYPVKVALIGGLGLSAIEFVVEKLLHGKVHTLSKFNFLTIALLGSFSLWKDEGIWFKLQPFFTGMIVGGFLLYKCLKGQGLMWESMEQMNKSKLPPREIWYKIEKHFSIFFIGYGLFMGGVALWSNTGTWLFFKTMGFYACFFIFFFMEILLIRRTLPKNLPSK